MYIASEILGVLAEIYTLHLFLQGTFSKKNKPRWLWITSYGVFAGIFISLSFVPNASFVRLGSCAVGILWTASVFFETKFSQSMYACAAFLVIYVLTEVMMMIVFSFARIDSQEIMSRSSSRAICNIAIHITLLFLTLLVLATTKRKRSAITLPFLAALLPGCIAGLLLGISFCQQVQAGKEELPLSFLIAAVGLLYMNILIVFYAEQAKASADRQRKMELAEQHYAMQEQYYAELRSEQEETRAMFHDINKCMLAMRALVDESNSEKAGEMLEEAQALFDGLGQVIDVGNPIISVILNEYKEAAEESDISFAFDVSVPQNLGMTAIDVYVLLGNTLDNAFEACAVLPAERRYIRLQMKMFHDILFYQIENPYSKGHLNRKKGKNHGYGLQNVRKCVEKYNGDISTIGENEVFVVSVRLNLADAAKATVRPI